MKSNSGVIWIKIGSVYIVLGIALGIYMGVNENFTLRPVHAHINLLGWVALTLFGLIYQQFPQIANTTLAKVQFWMHNLGLPVQMLLLATLVQGNPSVGPMLGIADIVVGLSLVIFLVNVFKNLKN